MEAQKTLLEYLLGENENERVLAVSDLCTQAEVYFRAATMLLDGMCYRVANDQEALRDLVSARKCSAEFASWIQGHAADLLKYAEKKTEPQPDIAKTDNAEAAEITVH